MEISELVEQVDIVAYISQYCELEPREDGEYWGLSPLKEEKTPSFSVSPTKQKFYDFASGKGGDVLSFVREYHECSLAKGVKILSQYAGIDEQDTSSVPSQRLAATSVAKKFRPKQQHSKSSAGVKLAADCMDKYEWDESKLSLWEADGIDLDTMRKFQVRYDPFSQRIVYPIRSPTGEIINISGRTIDPQFKERKVRKYTYFYPLGVLNTIYGLYENKDAILERKEIILFEGAKSVIIAHGWGIENTGALCTSHLNTSQFKLLIQLGVRVVFALDAEIDIRQDAYIKRLLPYVPVEWVKNRDGLLGDKDAPVDKGIEVWSKLYDRRERLR